MGILQEYRFVLILSVLFLGGIIGLFFAINDQQALMTYENEFAVKYEKLKDISGKSLKDVVLDNDDNILGTDGNNLLGKVVPLDQMFLVDDYNRSRLETFTVDIPDADKQGVYYFTTSTFSDGTPGVMDSKDILALDGDANNVDSGMDVPTRGGIIYVFESEAVAQAVIDDYFPASSLVAVNTIDGVQNIGVEVIFNSDTFEEASDAPVVDNIAPFVSFIGDEIVSHIVGTVYLDSGVSASDNIDNTGSLTIDIDDSGVDTAMIGSYTVVITTTDSAGNETILNRTVNVIAEPDTIIPIITLDEGESVDLEAGDVYSEQGYTATDNIDGDITASVVITGSVNESELGDYEMSYNVSDSSGNAADTIVVTVSVSDNTEPEITLVGSSIINLSIGDSYSEPGVTAYDSYDGDITGDLMIDDGELEVNTVGTYEIIYEVEDSSGNITSESRTVIVSDNENPEITLVGSSSISIEAGGTYSEAGYSSSDNADGDISASVIVTGLVNTNVPGTYNRTYNVTDSSGNAASEVVRTIIVTDSINPVITLLGSTTLTIEAGGTYSEAGYSASDTLDGDISIDVVVTGLVNTNLPGTYTRSYNVSDNAGNIALSKSRTITVSDTGIPVITLTGPTTLTIEAGGTYSEAGYTASDSLDGNITGDIVVTGVINTNVPGTYTRSYNVSDNAGNNAVTKSRTVTVQDTTNPVLTLVGSSVSVSQGGTYSEPGYSATDNLDGSITGSVVITGSVNTSVIGTYTLTYNVSDNAGNNANQRTRTITVIDPYITAHNNSSSITEDYESSAISIPLAATSVKILLDATTPGDSSVELRLATVDTLTPLATSGQISNTASSTSNYSHCGMQGSVLYTRKRDASGNLKFDCRSTSLEGSYNGLGIYNLPIGSIIKFYNPAATETWTNEIIYGTIASKLADSGSANASEYLYFATKTGDFQRPGVGNCSGTCVVGFKNPSSSQSYTAELVNNNYTLLSNSNLDGSTILDISGMTNSSYLKYRLWLTPDSSTGVMPTINNVVIKRNP